MASNTCPVYKWCGAPHTFTDDHDHHMMFDDQAPGLGVIRTDFVLDEGNPRISISETFEWEFPAIQGPSFFQALRANIDRAERRYNEFIAATHPLVRRTEPGEPEPIGYGGELCA